MSSSKKGKFLSDSGENGIIDVNIVEEMGTTDVGHVGLVQRMIEYIDETRKCALGMAINKGNFLMMVFYLMELKPMFDYLLKERELLTIHLLKEQVLEKLSDSLRDLFIFTHACASRSRVFLLYCTDRVVDEIHQHRNKLCKCLNMVIQCDLDLPIGIVTCIEALHKRLMVSNIAPETGNSDLAREISLYIVDSDSCEAHSTRLLRKIADHLNIPECEAAELKQELQNDARNAEIESESEGLECIETLRDLNRFFSSAEVLMDERRRLASIDSLVGPYGRITSIPSSFFCPITKSLMREPVTIKEEGYTYERSAILEWFDRGHKTCPDTGKELSSLELVPNLKLQHAMDEFFDHMRQAQIVSVLQELRNNQVIMCMPVDQAVQTVKRLMDMDPKYRQLVFSLDGVEPLIHLLKPSSDAPVPIRETVVKILIDISAMGDDHKVSMIEAGAVSVVLALLRNDPSEKYLIQLLSDLSKVDVGKKAIASERGSMLLLANVFRSTPPNERQLIKTLLDDLCEDDPEMIMDAAKCTIFEPLMSCLNQGRDKIRCEIITTILRSCELNELNSTPLVNAGIVTPLLLFLQKGSVEMIQVTVKLLAELSSVEQNKVLIAKAGAIPVLMKFLMGHHSLDQIKVDITYILSNLASDTHNAHEIDSEAAVVRLFTMMKSKDTGLQDYSLKTLQFMAKDSQTVRKHVVEMGMVPIFYALLRGKVSTVCHQSILNILCHISRSCEDSRPIIPSADDVKYLISLLGSNASMEEKESAVIILEVLLNAEETRSTILSDDKLLTLCAEYLQQGTAKMKESVGVLLSNFAHFGLEDPTILLAFSRTNVISACKAVIDDASSSEKTRKHAAEILCYLSSHTPHLSLKRSALLMYLDITGLKKFKVCRVHGGNCGSRNNTFCLIEANVVPSLVNLVRQGVLPSAEWAVKALYTLVENSENIRKGVDFLMQSNLLAPLIALIGKDQSSTEASILILEKVFRFKKYRDSKYGLVAKSALTQTVSALDDCDLRTIASTTLMHFNTETS